RTNFKDNWDRIISTFRENGAQGIYDVSLGADICTWAHVRYIQKHGTRGIISQPCPAIVNYITKYRRDLIGNLSPIHSPMLCTAIFLQKYHHIQDKLIFLSPCIGKADEFQQTSLDAFNFTFASLKECLDGGRLRLSSRSGTLDSFESGMGRIFSRPGGLKENVEFYLGSRLTVQRIEGIQKVYKYFDEINENSRRFLPDMIDALNCENGCNFGTGCKNDSYLLEVDSIMEDQKKDSMEIYPKNSETANELFDWFDQNLELDDYVRTYSIEDCGQACVPTMSSENAFKLLGKNTHEERNFNCGACGSHSCTEMADKISKGLNVPNNCVWRAKQELAQSGQKIGEFSQSLSTDVFKITEELRQAITELSSKNKQLADTLRTIDNIASTTRLLSFNASIEAKRAGAAGASFGVIAQKIKELSDDSSAAEEKTEQLVRDNKEMTDDAVGKLDQVKRMMLQISDMAKQLAVNE
ncbi:MAG: [Fe-Fe] hydrogenase large subunit C-terminal domain-containing protein, partial [Clostridia bacterium]|nr:[Fe-Fe] hydrogenase large subunit C-terminal domain-containing protein [Clostridia bacterium]